MSTRCCIEFADEGEDTWATIYRHSDGYPDGEAGVPADLLKFLMEIKQCVPDNRFSDACFLSAKFVVWQANEYASSEHRNGHRCDFNSLGISRSSESHGDLEFIYLVEGGVTPKISWREAGDSKVWHKCIYDLEAGTIEIGDGGAAIKVKANDPTAADKICSFVRKVLA